MITIACRLQISYLCVNWSIDVDLSKDKFAVSKYMYTLIWSFDGRVTITFAIQILAIEPSCNGLPFSHSFIKDHNDIRLYTKAILITEDYSG